MVRHPNRQSRPSQKPRSVVELFWAEYWPVETWRHLAMQHLCWRDDVVHVKTVWAVWDRFVDDLVIMLPTVTVLAERYSATELANAWAHKTTCSPRALAFAIFR